MQPVTVVKAYIAIGLMLAGYLLVGGCNATFFPKLKMVTTTQAQLEVDGYVVPQFEPSPASRVFGILRMGVGLGLAFYILKPFLPLRRK